MLYVGKTIQSWEKKKIITSVSFLNGLYSWNNFVMTQYDI